MTIQCDKDNLKKGISLLEDKDYKGAIQYFSELEKIYKDNPFKLLTKDEYIEIVCEQLQYLNENIVIHRLTGDPKPEDLIAPNWVVKKIDVLNGIDKYMAKNDIVQGKKVEKNWNFINF